MYFYFEYWRDYGYIYWVMYPKIIKLRNHYHLLYYQNCDIMWNITDNDLNVINCDMDVFYFKSKER